MTVYLWFFFANKQWAYDWVCVNKNILKVFVCSTKLSIRAEPQNDFNWNNAVW